MNLIGDLLQRARNGGIYYEREEHRNCVLSELKALDNILRKSLLEFKEVLIGSLFDLVIVANKNVGSSHMPAHLTVLCMAFNPISYGDLRLNVRFLNFVM